MLSVIEVSIIYKKDDKVITYAYEHLGEYWGKLPVMIDYEDIIIIYEEIPHGCNKYNLYKILHWNSDNPNRGLRK